MSMNECGFGRASDGFCTDEIPSLEFRAAQANLVRTTSERTKQRLAEQALVDTHEWTHHLIAAKNKSQIPFGNIDWEIDGPGIIEEAARQKGVDAPLPGSDEHSELLDEIRHLANLEHDELMRGTVTIEGENDE